MMGTSRRPQTDAVSVGTDHIQLWNGRAKACEKYPPRLEAAILHAFRQSMRAAGCGEAQGLMGRDSVDDRSSGGWADSRIAGAAVDPGQHRQCPRVQ